VTGTVTNVVKILIFGSQKFWSTAENTSAFKGYHNGNYISLCWRSITIIFPDIMSFQYYIVKELCFYNIQHKKRKQSILLLCCKGFPHIGKQMKILFDRVWNRPIMHCKPLSIEYVMYTYRLCLLNCMNLSDITLAMYTKLAAKKVLEIFSSQILCIEFFSE